MVLVINVNACPFLVFSALISHLQDTGIGFSGGTVPPHNEKNELGSSDQEASPSADKTPVSF